MKTENMLPDKDLQIKETLRVRFNETDPLGIVWHGHYITYFEEGREAFGRKWGLSYLDVQKQSFATPIVKSICEHFLPLKYGDTFTVETTFIPSDSAKLIFRYRLFNEAEQLVCSGETVQVFLDADGNLSFYNPPFFQKWKNKMGL